MYLTNPAGAAAQVKQTILDGFNLVFDSAIKFVAKWLKMDTLPTAIEGVRTSIQDAILRAA